MLCPDAAFMRAERLAGLGEGKDDWFPVAPDVAVEVLSPSERRRHVERKVALYLAAETAMVWLVDPRRRTVTIHRPHLEPQVLTATDTLDGGDALPGFTLPLEEIFR